MADDIDKLLDDASAGSIDSMLEERAAAPEPDDKPPRAASEAERKELQKFGKDEELPWYKRAARGAVDPILGAGQIIQNVVPDAVLNAGRKITDPLVNAVAGGVPRDTSDTSNAEFNAGVRREERAYQGERVNAGQEGIDWTRIGGTLANPITWLSPGNAATGGILTAMKAGAKAGAFQALLQPATSEGSFLWDKAMQGTVGLALGGTLGGALGALKPILKKVRDTFGKVFGSADAQAQAAAATQITDDVLRTVNAEPTLVDPTIRTAISQEVQDALKNGVTPDPVVMTNRADAAALPVPMQYTRGQATRDNMLYSWEINNSKRAGFEDLNQTLSQQNRQLVQNLDELGARKALSPFEASQQAIAKIQQSDEALVQQIDAAYQGVRDSAGRPALMDHKSFLRAAREGLKREQVSEFVPEPIRATINALELGNSPLTVDIAQQLDKVWSRAQRSTQDGNAKVAIGELRRALNDAPVSDTLGQDAMRAYQAARGLAKQRFDLIEANPAYKAVNEGSARAEPEKFFANFVAGSNVSELPGLKQLLGPDLVKTIQNTSVRQLKKAAVGSAGEGNQVFQQASYNNVLQSDVMGPRLRELFKEAPETIGHLYRLGRVAENIGKYPSNHSVNTSNSAPVAAEMLREVAESASGRTFIGGLINMGREANARAATRVQVRESLTSGVTAEPVRPKPSKSFGRLSDLIARGAGAKAATPEREE